MKLDPKEYDKMVRRASPPSPVVQDCLWAFFVGGAVLAAVSFRLYLASLFVFSLGLVWLTAYWLIPTAWLGHVAGLVLGVLAGVLVAKLTRPAIILLTDGQSGGSLYDFEDAYEELGAEVPVFSIMFGDADETQLEELAQYTNARVFDGRENLTEAFRSVKGYN